MGQLEFGIYDDYDDDKPVLRLAAEKCDFSILTEAAASQLHYRLQKH